MYFEKLREECAGSGSKRFHSPASLLMSWLAAQVSWGGALASGAPLPPTRQQLCSACGGGGAQLRCRGVCVYEGHLALVRDTLRSHRALPTPTLTVAVVGDPVLLEPVLRCRQGASGPNYRLFWLLLPQPLLLFAYLSIGCSFVRVCASPPRLPSPSIALIFGAPVLLHPLSRCSPPSHHAAAHSVDIERAPRGDCRFGLPSSSLCCIDVIVVICSVFPHGGLCGVRFVRGGNQDPPWRFPPITHPAA